MATFEDFVVERGPSLVRFTHALCGDRHLAEDLVQDVLVKVHGRWQSLTRPEAYVRAALCHELVSWRRRSHSEQPSDVPDVVESASSTDALLERDAKATP